MSAMLAPQSYCMAVAGWEVIQSADLDNAEHLYHGRYGEDWHAAVRAVIVSKSEATVLFSSSSQFLYLLFKLFC